ncbi:helicase-related protein [uncultured Mailhella sp.]|uniref:helicase-related protein n=1 Tax=uncultured Mailhella sp. TaxID=1981031 RepID=UPI0025F6CADC|nr:helicase-related protein [uncultured Mailhella sp.]
MELIDNINKLFGDDLKAMLRSKSRLKIAASCFSIYAYEALKKELKKIEGLEFIFTAPTFIADEVTDKIKKERREFFIPKAGREHSLYGTEFEIQLRNKLTQRAIARECADWLRSKAVFRSNKTLAPMQSMACVRNRDSAAVYIPLQGFTAVDLGYQQGNAISNFINRFDDPAITLKYLQLFDTVWNDADKVQDVTEQVCEHISSVYVENSPERLYFLILYNIFREFLDDISDDVLPNDRTGYQNTLVWKKLFNYQRDAAVGIINKLETYNGCILADSVGLGKTFTALAVVKYYELRNKSVLVLCPKKLAHNWLTYNKNVKANIFKEDRFNYDVLAHTDLSRTSGESFGIALNQVNWGNYDLVVIDESHNFRNNNPYKEHETRYQRLMNKVIREGVKTRVLMLSATPVNNRFSDLRNQLALAYEGDSDNLSKKLRGSRSVEEIFRRAQTAFNAWSKLPPEERTPKAILDQLDFDFFDLLDSVTIARSRKHIQTFYDTTDIGNFPQRRKPVSFRCPLTERKDVPDFNGIYKQLSVLTLCVYTPLAYLFPSRIKKYADLYDTRVDGKSVLRQADRERSLQALMTTNLLKRLESSVEAFRLTLGGLQENYARILESVANFKKNGSGFVHEGELPPSLEEEEEDMPTIGSKVKISLADMDIITWERDLAADLAVIESLLEAMARVTPEDDAKLAHLKAHVAEKIAHPINAGNRKILLFTAFADTARYLYEELVPEVGKLGLHAALVTGSSAPKSTLKKSYDFESVLTLFAPRAKEKDKIMPEEQGEIDLLIATDCISEGQNLQDCDYLINYDIHWNPVRIIQRFGRIDRIGSPNASIQLVNYWPDISLDEYINLKERVESRMIITDLTATGDDNILTAKSTDVSYRREQLRRLQEEVMEMEDLKTGISITDLGLNDFRMDLLNFVRENGDQTLAPKGLHAVVSARPELGLVPGVVFALRNLNKGVSVGQYNRLHPYYLLYIGRDGTMVAEHAEVKKILDLVRTACKGQETPLYDICRKFNDETAEGRDMKAYSALLSQAIQSMIEVKEERDIDSLFSAGRTTALVNTIAGLDDFELIAFLVVMP